MIALSLRILMFKGKSCRFIALNLKTFIKFVALSNKMSRKTNHRIALTDKFSIIAAHQCCDPYMGHTFRLFFYAFHPEKDTKNGF
jgi:hypothetical protein